MVDILPHCAKINYRGFKYNKSAFLYCSECTKDLPVKTESVWNFPWKAPWKR